MKFLKERFAEIVILVTVVLLTISLSLFVFDCIAYGEITGTIGCQAGELTIINSDREAAWSVFPADYSTSFAVSDDGKTLYFASPKQGKVTFFAASVVDGKPELENHTLYNGVEIPDDETTPTPAPKPEPAKTPLEKAIDSAKNYSAQDVGVITETFEAVLSGIDRGTITTPVAARETFRSLYASKAIVADPDSIVRTSPLITELSEAVDNSTLATVKDDYQQIVDGLKKIVPASTPAPEQKKEAPKPAVNSGCPNGQCYRRWGW